MDIDRSRRAGEFLGLGPEFFDSLSQDRMSRVASGHRIR